MPALEGLDLSPDGRGGTRLRLRVKAGARRDAVEGVHAGALRVRITAPPEKGKANRAVLKLLAGALGLAPSSLSLLSGHGTPDKSVGVPLEPVDVRARLEVCISPPETK